MRWRLQSPASHCLFNRLFRRRSKKTSKLRITGPCAGNSPVTGEFPAQKANSAENVSICWRHHGIDVSLWVTYSKTRTYIYVQNLLAVWSGIHVLQHAVSLYEEKWCEVERGCVFTYRHIYTKKKKSNIKIWNTCTTRWQFHLYQFVGPHWSRQWLVVIRQQAISCAKVTLSVVMWHHWVALG